MNIIESTNKKNAPKKDSQWWSAAQGKNEIRIIENPDTDAPPMFIAYKHFNVGPNGHSFWCRKTDPSGNGQRDWNIPCPVCDQVSALYDSGNEDDRSVAGRSKSTQRILLNIVDLGTPEKGVKVFECSATLWKIMHKYWVSKKYGPLADADEGYNFIVDRQGPTRQPKYDESTAVDDPSPIQNKDWPAQMVDLRELVNIKSFDALKSIMETGVDPEQEERKSKGSYTPRTEEKPSATTGEGPITEDDIPPFDTDDGSSNKETLASSEGTPKKKKSKKAKPPCFGEFDEEDDDCAECKWEGVCIEASDDEDDDVSEQEILDAMKK